MAALGSTRRFIHPGSSCAFANQEVLRVGVTIPTSNNQSSCLSEASPIPPATNYYFRLVAAMQKLIPSTRSNI